LAAGYTQESFAEKLGVDRSTVGRWERGIQSPQPWQRPDLAAALDISLDELDDLLRRTKQRDTVVSGSGSLARRVTGEGSVHGDDVPVQDSDAGAEPDADTGLPTISGLELIELTRQAEATDISPATLNALEVATDRLCRAYPTTDAAQLRTRTTAYLRYVLGRLDGRTTLAHHRELLVRAGWLALLLGCVVYDLGDRPAAGQARRLAFQLGRQAEHGQIIAWSYELGAWYALLEGRYPHVVDLSNRGLQHAGVSSAAVQLTLQAGRGYARMGDTQARTYLDAGRKILEQLPDPEHPEHHFVFDPDKHTFYVATILTWLGKDDTAAEEHAREVVRYCHETGRWPTRLGTTLINLGMLAGRRGDLDEAIEHGTTALELNRRSAELIPRAKELYQDLTSRYPKERLVDHFRERLAEAKREVPSL
jgi:transcriptional regulator with XRE-family HTH domain